MKNNKTTNVSNANITIKNSKIEKSKIVGNRISLDKKSVLEKVGIIIGILAGIATILTFLLIYC